MNAAATLAPKIEAYSSAAEKLSAATAMLTARFRRT